MAERSFGRAKVILRVLRELEMWLEEGILQIGCCKTKNNLEGHG